MALIDDLTVTPTADHIPAFSASLLIAALDRNPDFHSHSDDTDVVTYVDDLSGATITVSRSLNQVW